MCCWKRLVCSLAISLVVCQKALAAGSAFHLRHVQGFQGLELSAGAGLELPLLSLSYTYYLTRVWHLTLALGMASGAVERLTMNDSWLLPLVAYTLWSHQSNYYVSGLAGCLLANRWQEHARSKQQQEYFRLGLVLGGELEIYLSNLLVLVLTLSPQIHFLHTNVLGWVHWMGTVGLRITF